MFEPDGPDRMRVAMQIDMVVTEHEGITHRIRIPEGFVFDGATIPRLCWSLIGAPFEPDYILAACVHDWYCARAKTLGDYQIRVIGDGVFFWLLKLARVPRWRRRLMYAAVRLHSWWKYGADND